MCSLLQVINDLTEKTWSSNFQAGEEISHADIWGEEHSHQREQKMQWLSVGTIHRSRNNKGVAAAVDAKGREVGRAGQRRPKGPVCEEAMSHQNALVCESDEGPQNAWAKRCHNTLMDTK